MIWNRVPLSFSIHISIFSRTLIIRSGISGANVILHDFSSKVGIGRMHNVKLHIRHV